MKKKDFEKFLSIHAKDGIIFSEENKLVYQNEEVQFEWNVEDISKDFGIYYAKEIVDIFKNEKIKANDELDFAKNKISINSKVVKTQEVNEEFSVPEYDKEINMKLSISCEQLKDIINGTTNILETSYPELNEVFLKIKDDKLNFISCNMSVITIYEIHDIKTNVKNTYSLSSKYLEYFLKFQDDENVDLKLSLLCNKGQDFYILLQSENINMIFKIYKNEMPFSIPEIELTEEYVLDIDGKELKKTITKEKKLLPSALQTSFGVLAQVNNDEIKIGNESFKNSFILPNFSVSASDLLRITNLSNEIIFGSNKKQHAIYAKNIFYINEEK